MSDGDVGEHGADSSVDPEKIVRAVFDAADRLRAAGRRVEKRSRIELIETLGGLFDELARARHLYLINQVARRFSVVAMEDLPPHPEQVLAYWELAYRSRKPDLNELEKEVERATTGLDRRTDAWRAARKRYDKWHMRYTEAVARKANRKHLLPVTEELNDATKKMFSAEDEVIQLISPSITPPGGEPFDPAKDYVGDLARAFGYQPALSDDGRRRGMQPDGRKIRQMRELREWSRAGFAAQIRAAGYEISERTIARVEEGKRSDRRTLEAFAATLNVSLDELRDTS